MTDRAGPGGEPTGGKVSATATARMTAEQLGALEDFRGELVRGELVPMSPNHGAHEKVSVLLLAALQQFVGATGPGHVLGGQMGYILARDPDTVRAPDASYMALDRLPPDWSTSFIEGAPDLAVEIRSPSDRAPEVLAKVADYLRAGSHLVWVVDPKRRAVAIYAADGAVRELAESDTPDGGDVLPGLTLPVAGLFEGLPRQAPPSPAA